MTVPKHLRHKPVVAVKDYNLKDGRYAPDSDAKALSIGEAQYDGNEFSAKVFRHTGSNWSRQSEEVPIHRALDLAILIIASMHGENKNGQQPISTLNEAIVAPERHQELLDYYKANQKTLQPRLRELKKLLNSLGTII